MFGDNEGLRLGQIMHLTRGVIKRHGSGQCAAAARAGLRKMIGDFIGVGGLPERLAFMALLPARLSAEPLTQASHARRLLQTVSGRWLAAVGAVQAQTAFEFRHTSQKHGDLRCLRLYQRGVFSRKRLNLRDQLFP